MNTTLRALFLCLISLAAADALARDTPLIEIGRTLVVLPDGQPTTADALRRAIFNGAQRAGWTVSEDAPGAIRLRLIVRNKHNVVVDVVYDKVGYDIRYLSSINMNYELKKGTAYIHPNYMNWVQKLNQAILAQATQD